MVGMANGNVATGVAERQSEQARAAAAAAAAIAAPAPPGSAGGGRGNRRGGGSGENDVDSPPASIMHAAYVGALELVKSMVEVGIPADAPDSLRGSTPLHWASYGGHLDVVRWLVKTAGADANKSNSDGCTPLFFACERGHLGVAQWLVREAAAEVNVKDSVMWQTPLHRVCLNARAEGAAVSEMEDLILWLVEAGADLTAVDRFGNHVEDLRSSSPNKSLSTTGSGSKLCDMISAAREEGVPDDETREKLKRRGAVRKRSGTESVVQLSPKLEAKQRAPMSRRGNRKTGGGSSNASQATEGTNSGSSGAASPTALPDVNLTRSGSHRIITVVGSGGRVGIQRKKSSGSSRGSSRGSSKAGSESAPDWSEETGIGSNAVLGGGGGSGGGVAAPPAGTGARMGGGPPVPAVAGGEEVRVLSNGKMPSMVASEQQQQQQQQPPRHNSNDSSRSRRQPVIAGSKSAPTDPELQQQESLRVAEEALKKTELREPQGDAATVEARRRLDGAGQQVVDKIRELTADRRSGAISDVEFANLKRQLLEMEQLRREAEEEARKRQEGQGEDAGVGILTSVGQNTPPPSPKSRAENGDRTDDDDDAPIQILVPTGEKDMRETYKASDIERYTSNQPDGPRVFGEVPESVKESLAAKEAAKEAARAAAAAAAAAKEGKGDEEKKLKGKKKSGSIPSKNGTSGGDTGAGSGSTASSSGGNGGAARGDASGGMIGSGGSGGMHEGVPNKATGGCVCVIM
ncbi:unnamed protein product [Scytosiphon promiscuus]